MALRVWLPLNGDLENKGISDISISTNNFSINNLGKLGKCYQGHGLTHLSQEILNNNWSIALWVKETSAWSQYNQILFCKNLKDSSDCQIYFSIINGKSLNLGINGPSGTGSYNYNFNLNTWYHVAATYDGLNYCLYINGTLVKTGTCTTVFNANKLNLGFGCRSANDNATSGTGQTSTQCFNDFRIYDHCLSPLEVKEISQGLILHYKLDNQYIEATENLLPQTIVYTVNNNPSWDTSLNGVVMYTPNGWSSGYNGGVSEPTTGYHMHWIFDEYNNLIMYSPNKNSVIGKTGRWMGISSTAINLVTKGFIAGCKYTISWWQKTSNLSLGAHPGLYYKLTSSGSNGFQDGSPRRYNTLLNTWQKMEIIFTMSSSFDGTAPNATVYFYGDSSVEGDLYIKDMQLELKDHSTPYVGGGQSRQIENIADSSGYGNNGTVIGSLTTEMNNTDGRYLIATKFPTNTAHIQLPVITYSNFGSSYTFSWWEYLTTVSSSPMPWGFSDGNRLNCYHVNTSMLCWNTSNGTNNPFEPNITSTSLLNGWHHLVITGNGTVTNLYIDGEYKAKAKTYVGLTGTQIWLSGWANATGYSMVNNKMSDFRIYATALSAEDIATLYHTPAQIDNLGGVHGFEINEEQANIFRYELINPYAKTPNAVGTGEWSLRNGEWAMNIKPAPFHQNWEDGTKSAILVNEIQPNTQYVVNLWIDADEVNNGSGTYSNAGLRVYYTDGTSQNFYGAGGDGVGFQHRFGLTDASKSISLIYVVYSRNNNTYYRWDSYICPVDKESIVKEGLIKSTQFIENNSLASIHESGSMLSPNIIEK